MRKDLTQPVPDEPVSAEYIYEVGKQMDFIIPSYYVEYATTNNGSAVLPYLRWVG